MNFLKSVTTVGAYTVASRIGGFIREVLTASFLGAGAQADALAVAIKLPSLFRRLFAEGVLNACFVPIFSGLWAEKGAEEARGFARQIFSFFCIALLLLTFLFEFFLPHIVTFLLPGFSKTPERMYWVVLFSRITFPFIFFISLTAIYSGILNSIDRFAAAASSPMAGNIFIALAVALCGYTAEDISGYTFSWVILGSGFVQLLWVVVPAKQAGFFLVPVKPQFSPAVRKFFTSLGPAALGAGVVQINLFIGMFIASWLPVGSIAYLNYADRLNQLPLSVIGVAVSTALLPLLSRQLRMGNVLQANKNQNMAIELSLLLTVPAAFALIFFAEPLVGVMFEHGAFCAADTKKTASALAAYACGLPAYVLVKIFSTRFFAVADTRTPLFAGALGIGVDIFLSLLFIGVLQHVGIALATAASSWVNAGVLGVVLWRRGDLQFKDRLGQFLSRLTFTSLVCVFVLHGVLFFVSPFLIGAFAQKALLISFLIIAEITLFFVLARLFGAVKYEEFFKGLSRPCS